MTKEHHNADELAGRLETSADAIMLVDGDRDHMNASDLTCNDTQIAARLLREAAITLRSHPQQPQGGVVSDPERAIEFGEYLAVAVEQFMDFINKTGIAAGKPAPQDAMTDHWRGLQSAIYDFRKRKDKALAALPSPVAGTPAARWRERGEPDPTPQDYERSQLPLGQYTDDEMANAAYLSATHIPEPLANAAKQRMRWLSRRLSEAEAKLAAAPSPVAEDGDDELVVEAQGKLIAIFANAPWLIKDGKAVHLPIAGMDKDHQVTWPELHALFRATLQAAPVSAVAQEIREDHRPTGELASPTEIALAKAGFLSSPVAQSELSGEEACVVALARVVAAKLRGEQANVFPVEINAYMTEGARTIAALLAIIDRLTASQSPGKIESGHRGTQSK